MKNDFYVWPDNGRFQAIIQTGRGCPFECVFCMVPPMTGKEFHQRSVMSVMAEIRDCVENYGIDQIFFRADTFTVSKEWVKELALAIKDSGMRISWCANSRANILDAEMLDVMKKSGCWLLAFGFESGSEETLQRIRKGTTVGQNEQVRELCKKYGIQVHGQYIIGFPWEGKAHCEETFAHIRRMQCDFIDVQILVPYRGTRIYEEMAQKYPSLIDAQMGSKISGGITGTAQGLTKKDLLYYQRAMLRSTYLSPHSIGRKIIGIRSFAELRNYMKYGYSFVMNQFFSPPSKEGLYE